MDFQRLTVFRAVARYLSFSRAADELHLTQPAVSKHIHQLEAELGVPLFHRLGRRIELTDAGHIVADYAQRVSVLSDEVRRVLGELEGLERGYLRLGASTTPGLYLLPDMVALFRKKYPAVEISLAITNSSDVTRRVLTGEFDLGFVGAPVETAGLQVRPFVEDEIVLIVPASHSLSRQRTFSPTLFASETLIMREAGSATRRIVEENLARLNVTPKSVMEMNGCEGMKRAVAAGIGLAFASRYSITLEVAQKILNVPEIQELQFARSLFLIARKNAHPSAVVLAFSALIQKRKPSRL